MNDAIDFLGDFYLSVVFEVFLELFIKVGDQRFCCLFILINEVFKGGFNCQVYVGVTIEGFLEQIDHFLSELDYVFDQFLVLDTFVFDQLLSFRDDVGFENRLELIQSFWASFEETEHQLNFSKFVLLDHLDETRVLHIKKSGSVVFDVLSQEHVQDLVHA